MKHQGKEAHINHQRMALVHSHKINKMPLLITIFLRIPIAYRMQEMQRALKVMKIITQLTLLSLTRKSK
jgi:hypothetical protein